MLTLWLEFSKLPEANQVFGSLIKIIIIEIFLYYKVCFDIHWDGLKFYLHPLILLLLNPVLSSTGWQIIA